MGRVLSLLTRFGLVALAVCPSLSQAFTCPDGQVVTGYTLSAVPSLTDTPSFNNGCAVGDVRTDPRGCLKETTERLYTFNAVQWRDEFRKYNETATEGSGGAKTVTFLYERRSCQVSNGSCGSWQAVGSAAATGTPNCGTAPQTEPTQGEICAGMQGNVEGVDVALGAATACVDGCMVDVTGTGSVGLCFGASCPTEQQKKSTEGTYTGATCDVGVDDPSPQTNDTELLPDGTGGVCVTGTKKCVSSAKKNCGYVNGEYRCITSSQLTPDNPCVTTASGAQFCRDDAPTPPVPNNGTPGEEATPDAQFQLFETRTGGGSLTGVNYYSPERVRLDSGDGGNDDAGEAAGEGDCGSTRKPCHVVVDGGSAGSGDGGGDGTAPAECGAPGQPPCKIDEGGDGDKNFDGPADPEAVNDFGQSLTNFRSSIGASPIAQAMAGLANGIPTGGATPSASFQAFDRTFVYAVPPEVESAIRAVLSVVMKLVWSIVAVMWFMRA